MKEALDRRDFLKTGVCAGLVIAFRVPGEGSKASAEEFSPNAFLNITPDDKVVITVTRSEMGQGVRTAIAMMLADELGADWKRIELEQASPGGEFKEIRLRTAGSGSIWGTWFPFRRAGASAREVLIGAASNRWNVPSERLSAEKGRVIDKSGGRSLTFGELCLDAAKLPLPAEPSLKDPKDFTLIGRPVKRVDGEAIVNGSAVYAQDISVPGMLHAVIEHSPAFGGRPLKWNEKEVLAVPGVVAVAPVTKGIKPGLAVIARTHWQALKGREALSVDWKRGSGEEFSSDAYRSSLSKAFAGNGFTTRDDGETVNKLDGSPDVLSAVYEYPFQAHAPMEPVNCVADVREDSCEIWCGTQAPEDAMRLSAELLGIPEERVRVNIPLLGGGFGRKLFVDHVLETVEISRAVKAPVKVLWTRIDDTKHGFFHSFTLCEMKAAIGPNGIITAFLHRTASSDLSMFGPPALDAKKYVEGWDPWGAYDNPYKFGSYRCDYHPIDSPVPTGAWRAVGYPQNVFARECFVDEIAHKLHRDPLQFRLELLDAEDASIGDLTIRRRALGRVLELAAAKAGWNKPLSGREETRRGRGVACNVYHGQSLIAQIAEVSISRKGEIKVDRIVCAVECGRVVNPLGLEGQIESGIVWGLSAALKGEITFKGGQAERSSFGDFEVLRMNEMPLVEVYTVPSTERPVGMGEPPVPPVAPAVANAVFAATGKRLRKLPLRL